MPVKHIPDGYHTTTPYLVVPGAAKVIDFLKQAFDAQELHRMAPPNGPIMHAEVKIGDSHIMLSDPVGEFKPMPAMIYIYVKDCDAAYKRAVQAGGVSLKEPADQFYGDRTASVRDSGGNMWWIATHIEDIAPEEMARRAEAAMKQGAS